MWWDWTEITLLDSVLFSILSLLTLYLVGSGILRLIGALSKKTDPFSSFDFLARTNFRIFFGFIFIFLLVFIFSTFNFPFLISTLLVIAIAIIGFAIARPSFKLELPKKIHFQNYASVIIAFVVLLATTFLSSMLITGSYGSTNDDGADHTLMTRIILNNPSALLTHISPHYVGFALYYPLAPHVLCAFLVTLLGVLIQKIVIMVSVILPCLISLSIYSAIKSIFNSKALSILGLVIAAFFTVSTSFVPVSWGGLPVLLSFYISISSMGLIFAFLLKKKMNLLNAALLGLIFFIASQTYPVALLFVLFWFLLILSAKLLPKFRNLHRLKVSDQFSRFNVGIIIAFLIPMLFSIPYFYSIYTHNVAGHQFSVLSSVVNVPAETVKARIAFNWLFDIPALSAFFSGFGQLLALASYSLILLIVLLIPKVSQKLASIFPSREFAHRLILIYFFVLMILAYLTLTLYLPINFLTVYLAPERVWQHIFILATILTTVVIFFAVYVSYSALKQLFHSDKTSLMKLNKNRIFAYVLLALLIFNVGLASIPLVKDQQAQYNTIGPLLKTYETLNQSDILLMNWIKENIPSNACILVSAGDSGQFVTAVTNRQTISKNNYLANYNDLMSMLTSNASDLRAAPIMIEYNVLYVYIGSIATTYALDNPAYRHFNATQFLSTPYFSLAKEIGDAWLFQFNASAALAAYNAAGPLPKFVEQPPPQPQLTHFINIIASEGGYTRPSSGIRYGSGVLAINAYPNEGYRLDHWILNGSYLTGPTNPINVDYLNWNVQAVFINETTSKKT
jgi:hypothetical protein